MVTTDTDSTGKITDKRAKKSALSSSFSPFAITFIHTRHKNDYDRKRLLSLLFKFMLSCRKKNNPTFAPIFIDVEGASSVFVAFHI